MAFYLLMLKNRMIKTTMEHIMRFNTTAIFQKFVVSPGEPVRHNRRFPLLAGGTSSPPYRSHKQG